MLSYTSDVNTVYSNIKNGIMSNNDIRILSSKSPQSLSLIKDFPNIEEIHCKIVCIADDIHSIYNLLSQRPFLTMVSFIILISDENDSNSDTDFDGSPIPKRRRVESNTQYDDAIKYDIPDILRKLGDRMKYINLSFMFIGNLNSTISQDPFVSVLIFNKGLFYIDSFEGENNKSEKIFKTFASTKCLSSLMTTGDSNYNLDDIFSIDELIIIPREFNQDNPINSSYLETLVSLSKTITILYDSKSINDFNLYSLIIKRGTKGDIKRIKGIVPITYVDDHIKINETLEEIHTLVEDANDVKIMKNIIEKYQTRDITYYIYYHKKSQYDIDYWSSLKNTVFPVDVIFKDIVRHFIS